MGLQLLEREKVVFQGNDRTQPDFAGYEYILERQLKPEARRDIVELLREKGVRPTAMIDISDGLASEVMHICKDSKVGCNLYEERIPIDYQTFQDGGRTEYERHGLRPVRRGGLRTALYGSPRPARPVERSARHQRHRAHLPRGGGMPEWNYPATATPLN